MYTNEQVEAIALQLLPNFIPKDASATELSFHFTMPPENFKVSFAKDAKNKWQFIAFERVLS